jgi:membrane protein
VNRVKALLRRADTWQRRHRAVGFGYAVIKKFGDDNAGNSAALLAYYAFFSIFPLLLVLVTVLGLALRGDPHLQSEVLSSGLRDFPVIGTQLRTNAHSLSGNGFGLAVGIAGTLLGARGVANAAQSAFNTVWHVPLMARPGFPWNQLRSVALVVVFGGGLLVSAVLQTVIAGVHPHGAALGAGFKAAGYVIATVLNIVVFIVAFRLGTAKSISTRSIVPGAVVAALTWEVLEAVGGLLINHDLKNASSTYGTFALVIGLLTWFYLQAQLSLYAIEIDSVRVMRLWPRGLSVPPLTDADKAAYTLYTKALQRRPEEVIDVRFDEPAPDGRSADGPSADGRSADGPSADGCSADAAAPARRPAPAGRRTSSRSGPPAS